MGKNFKKNTPNKSFDGKGVQNKGPGSITKPGSNQKGNNRYFSKQLENVKSPAPNVAKSPKSLNKSQNQKFGSNKKSPMQMNKSPKSPANSSNKKSVNGKGKNNQASPSIQKQVAKKVQSDSDESESESFSEGEGGEGFNASMLSKIMKENGEDDSDYDDDFDLDDSEDDEDDSEIQEITAGKKRKLEDDSEDDLDDDALKAMLEEESSDENNSPPAKKSKAVTKSPPKATTPNKGKAPITTPNPSSKQPKKNDKKAPLNPVKQQDKKDQKPPVVSEACSDSIKLPAPKAATLKVSDKEKILKQVKERLDNLQCRTVFIKPVPRNCSLTMLKELAKEIVDAKIPFKGKNGRGFAILEFKTPQVAEKYKGLLNGKIFCGKNLSATVNSSKNQHQSFDPSKVIFNELYVSGLPKETTRADLKYIFPESNAIELPAMKDNACKGFAVITFALPETALNNFETRDQTVIRNRTINVNFSIKKNSGKQSKKAAAKKDTKNTKKQPAIKLSEIAPQKASVKVSEMMDDSDESETEDILAAMKQKKQAPVSGTLALQEGSSDDVKSPPAKRKPAA